MVVDVSVSNKLLGGVTGRATMFTDEIFWQSKISVY